MRDIIWTIIIIWVVYKLVDIFRSAGQRKKQSFSSHSNSHAQPEQHISKKDKESALRKGAEKEGEYIDFEEIG